MGQLVPSVCALIGNLGKQTIIITSYQGLIPSENCGLPCQDYGTTAKYVVLKQPLVFAR